MAHEPHAAVVAVRETARAVLAYQHQVPSRLFWRRWFEGSEERHMLDDVRAFTKALIRIQDVPPLLLTAADLKEVGDAVQRVVEKIESTLDDTESGSAPLAAAVYVIRSTYEALYRRGTTG